MAGLARRIEHRGSWLVRVSLVQVAHWLAGPAPSMARAPPTARDELARYLMKRRPVWHLRYLKPVTHFSETPAYFAGPPSHWVLRRRAGLERRALRPRMAAPRRPDHVVICAHGGRRGYSPTSVDRHAVPRRWPWRPWRCGPTASAAASAARERAGSTWRASAIEPSSC
jgi:hypothetical protein